jgi:hypothetical protein
VTTRGRLVAVLCLHQRGKPPYVWQPETRLSLLFPELLAGQVDTYFAQYSVCTTQRVKIFRSDGGAGVMAKGHAVRLVDRLC